MKRIQNYFRRFGYDIGAYKTHNGQPDPLRPWETDSAFLKVYNAVLPITLVDRKKLYMLWQIASQTQNLDGAMAECGVYKGGTALLLAETKHSERYLHLYDTFEGMPQTDPSNDEHNEGDFNDTSLAAVQKLFTNKKNVFFHAGFFPDTAKSVQSEKFSLVHCDTDIYASVLACCDFFYPRLVNGGVIVFDDYGAPSCPGALKAVKDFCASAGVYEIYLPSGQAIIYKY